MSSPRRAGLPDNLDPLVDTLSNVVGILVIVIALTQLELSDAIARVARAAASSSQRPAPAAPPPAASVDADPALWARLDTLRSRVGADLDGAVDRLEQHLERLESAGDEPERPAEPEQEADGDAASARLETDLASAREQLELARTSRTHRRRYAAELVEVPRRLVARIPDPREVEGRESWILVRRGRVYPIEREALFERGVQGITRIVPDGATRKLRPDEYASVAHYLRKQEIGLGPHRWLLETEPVLRVSLGWRTFDGGIERTRLASDPGFAEWLARRDPARDVVRFQVWSDSFETYLEARTQVEAAGFQAGWVGHEADAELAVALRFGQPLPEVRPRAID